MVPSPLERLADLANLTSLGIIQPHCNYSTITIQSHFHLLCIARYSFIQVSELRLHGERLHKNTQVSKSNKGDTNPGFLDRESYILPLSNDTTVEPLSNDHPHQWPSLLCDHISCDRQCFLFVRSLTNDHPSNEANDRVRWNFLPRGWPHRVFQNDYGMNTCPIEGSTFYI